MIFKINKKGGMELSMNTIVILVVSIITFGFAITLAINLINSGGSKVDLAFDNYENQKFQMSCDNQKVCIETTKTSNNNDVVVYRMIINNINDSSLKFKISPTVKTWPQVSGVNVDNHLTYDNSAFTINSGANAQKVILIDPKNLKKGTYQFEVEIYADINNPTSSNIYTKKLIYLYIE